jgi:integrase/recombinase XerD
VPPIRLRPELSRQRFIRDAARWLAFIERLQHLSKSTKPYESRIVEFAEFMLHERGFSAVTIEQRCHAARQMLEQLCDGERQLEGVTVSDIDSILAAKVNQGHYVRASVQTCASSLRSFWSEVQTLLGGMDGNTVASIRDRAIMMVLAVYGVRAGEVAALRQI